MANTAVLLHREFIREIIHRLYGECMPRIKICLEKLSDDQIWWTPNPNCNSIGNLILHLQGNVRQWVGFGLGNLADVRERNREFAEKGGLSGQELWTQLSETMTEMHIVLERVPMDKLLLKRHIQSFEETGIGILVHVTEHFSYHTGQIAWITKMLTQEDLGFYRDLDL